VKMVASLHTTSPLKHTSSAASTLRPIGCIHNRQHKQRHTSQHAVDTGASGSKGAGTYSWEECSSNLALYTMALATGCRGSHSRCICLLKAQFFCQNTLLFATPGF
jgi:hypothetical protein